MKKILNIVKYLLNSDLIEIMDKTEKRNFAARNFNLGLTAGARKATMNALVAARNINKELAAIDTQRTVQRDLIVSVSYRVDNFYPTYD